MNKRIPLIETIINQLLKKFSDNIISIYGIGSYFDDSLPSDWIKNDLDIIVIIKMLDPIPKLDWTDVRYEKKRIEGHDVWVAYNTLESYQDKEMFERLSFSNYEWSLLDLKLPENSMLLYGPDIRDQLPDISEVKFDFENIFPRSLYHLDKSFKAAILSKNVNESMEQFTKGVFKFGFYLCIYLDNDFRYTSIRAIANKIEEFTKNGILDAKMLDFMIDAIKYRRKMNFKKNFKQLRNSFTLYMFSLLAKGTLHRKMKYNEIISYLEGTFGGLSYLIKFLERSKKKHQQAKLEDSK